MRAGRSGEGDGARVFHKGGVRVLEGTSGRGGASELGRTHRVRDLGGTSRDRELWLGLDLWRRQSQKSRCNSVDKVARRLGEDNGGRKLDRTSRGAGSRKPSGTGGDRDLDGTSSLCKDRDVILKVP